LTVLQAKGRSHRARWSGLALAGLALAASACGGSASANSANARPIAVPANVLPAQLDPGLTTAEYTAARQKFISAGAQSLVSRGELWQIRQGKVLAGALQVSTLKPTVNPTDNSERTTILTQVLPGAYETIQVDHVAVAAAQTASEVFYMWFGPHLFEVLQIKKSDAGLPYEGILAQIIQYQRSNNSLGILVTTTTTA